MNMRANFVGLMPNFDLIMDGLLIYRNVHSYS